MAHGRSHSISEAKNPHSLSLKVLRLSRPSLSHQYPLPLSSKASDVDGFHISPLAALTVPYTSDDLDLEKDTAFTLTPALTLPSSFASAYVGETFACTLSANNELSADSEKTIGNVKITADMQSPSNPSGAPLTVEGDASLEESATEAREVKDGADLPPAGSLQRIIRLDLKEEGSHILAVTVTYTESQIASGQGSKGEDGRRSPAVMGARVRTFRKLYQFVAQQLLSVRTKTGEVGVHTSSEEKGVGESRPSKYVLEAQLENMGEGTVCLEEVSINAKEPFESTSLNWDMPSPNETAKAPLLSPRDVVQVAFLLQRKPGSEEEETLANDGRKVLGQLSIQWRGHMGDKGSLSTGWLTAKAR